MPPTVTTERLVLDLTMSVANGLQPDRAVRTSVVATT
jgi:hypothetical protein